MENNSAFLMQNAIILYGNTLIAPIDNYNVYKLYEYYSSQMYLYSTHIFQQAATKQFTIQTLETAHNQHL